jgi:hypothetical protein
MAASALHYEVVKLNLSGTLVDYSSAITKFTMSTETNTGTYFTLEGRGQKAVSGGVEFSGSFELLHDNASSSAFTLTQTKYMTPATIAFEVTSPDALTGAHKATGTMYIKSIDPITAGEAGSGDVKVSTVEFVATGVALGLAA